MTPRTSCWGLTRRNYRQILEERGRLSDLGVQLFDMSSAV